MGGGDSLLIGFSISVHKVEYKAVSQLSGPLRQEDIHILTVKCNEIDVSGSPQHIQVVSLRAQIIYMLILTHGCQ